jgi:hypothetical protein
MVRASFVECARPLALWPSAMLANNDSNPTRAYGRGVRFVSGPLLSCPRKCDACVEDSKAACQHTL